MKQLFDGFMIEVKEELTNSFINIDIDHLEKSIKNYQNAWKYIF